MIRALRLLPIAMGALLCSLGGVAVGAVASSPASGSGLAPPIAADGAAVDAGSAVLRKIDVCDNLALAPWPRGASDRRSQLHRFDLVRTLCIGHARFLAALGALWLEEGEPAQALLWLERSLLLDPENLGAQADHALALAAMGDYAARDALALRWQSRSDVPPALRERLAVTARRPAVKLGGDIAEAASGPRWLFYREATLLAGHETNLDHSPRLSEITLTPPEGAIELPLFEPIVPRRGSAYLADLSLQLAHSPRTGLVFQTGLLASARHSDDEPETDWHHLQWAASASQQWGAWRGQLQLGAIVAGGVGLDHYRVLRAGTAIEREAVGCSHRLSIEFEARAHRDNPRQDGRTTGLLWNSLCPLALVNGWSAGLAARLTKDRPDDVLRTGGVQQQSSMALRLGGPLPASIRFEGGLRRTRLADSEGYSPLLENGANRQVRQTTFSAELSRPVRGSTPNGLDLVFQLQRVRQDSNLAIFRYSGTSAFGGLRAKW